MKDRDNCSLKEETNLSSPEFEENSLPEQETDEPTTSGLRLNLCHDLWHKREEGIIRQDLHGISREISQERERRRSVREGTCVSFIFLVLSLHDLLLSQMLFVMPFLHLLFSHRDHVYSVMQAVNGQA
jgi:hypothetical protein